MPLSRADLEELVRIVRSFTYLYGKFLDAKIGNTDLPDSVRQSIIIEAKALRIRIAELLQVA